MSAPPSPDALLRGCLRHEPAAQEAFYQHFAPKLLHICVRYARSRTQAEDLVQEAFIRVFERLGQYGGEGALEGWVRRVAVNTCLDHYRVEARRWQELDLDAAADLSSDDSDALSRLAAQDLVALIARLPDHYRLVLNLYCVEGYTHKEIGDQLGLDERTSSSQLSRARRLLAELVRRSERILSNELY